MRVIAIPLFIIGYYIAYVSCDGYSKDYSNRLNELASGGSGTDNGDEFIDKRAERYGFGLGRRAYTYTSGGPGVKRLPVYNFGLGKRASRPYSFGLGKRSSLNEDNTDYSDNDAPSLYDSAALYQMMMPLENKYDDIKRSRPYSFGLGKRSNNEEVERRSGGAGGMQRYNFGLGRR